ncbi:MAG TPA: hypothetical protein VGH93_06140, partial [Solirubrobacteraceae bacterium]
MIAVRVIVGVLAMLGVAAVLASILRSVRSAAAVPDRALPAGGDRRRGLDRGLSRHPLRPAGTRR